MHGVPHCMCYCPHPCRAPPKHILLITLLWLLGVIPCSYSPVWRANETSLEAAAEVLEQGVAAALPEAELIRVVHLPQGEYRAYAVGRYSGIRCDL